MLGSRMSQLLLIQIFAKERIILTPFSFSAAVSAAAPAVATEAAAAATEAAAAAEAPAAADAAAGGKKFLGYLLRASR